MNAVLFEPQHNGEVMIEWKKNGRGYAHARVNVRQLSRASFKRLVRWIINSGEWYLDYSLDSYGEEYGYGTATARGEGLEYLSPLRIARWLIGERR